jgi:hypothetical protein
MFEPQADADASPAFLFARQIGGVWVLLR